MTTPHSSEVLLQLSAGEVTYAGGVVAMRGIDLDVRRGEFLVLLGPSGAGKSTLLRSLNGLVPLSAGTLVAGQAGPVDSPRALRSHRRRTAFVFQQHHLIGRLTALGNVLTGRLAFHAAWRTLLPMPRADRLVALDALARVGLLEHALQRADRLSGGQQQRVGIARALAQQPAVLLADEPVASLDPATAVRVLELIHRICKDAGIAAVVSLHQVDLARRFADRVIGVAGGRVVFDDAPALLDATTLHAIYGGEPEAAATRRAPEPAAIVRGEPAFAI